MAQGCGATCSKLALFGFNFIFWLTGCLLMALGIIALVSKDFKDLEVFVPPDNRVVNVAGYVLIGMGAIVFIVGFCGCCGAVRESRCLLSLFVFCVLIIMGCEIAMGVYVTIKKVKIENEFTKEAKKMLNSYPGRNETNTQYNLFKIAVDDVQSRHKCCGIDGREDWNNTKFFEALPEDLKEVGVPPSCCPNHGSTAFNYQECQTTAYKSGCKDKMLTLIAKNLPIVMGVGFGIGAFEIIGVVLAICLCRNIAKEQSEHVY